MIGNIQKSIIIRAMRIRKEAGEDPEKILKGYKNLTEEERKEILRVVEQQGDMPWSTYRQSSPFAEG